MYNDLRFKYMYVWLKIVQNKHVEFVCIYIYIYL